MSMKFLFLLNLSVAVALRVRTPTEKLEKPKGETGSCTEHPRGQWHKSNGTEWLEKFWALNDKYPTLCHMNRDFNNGLDGVCSADSYGETYFSECLKPFDASAFLQSIAGKSISFIGDSLNYQLYAQFLCGMAEVGDQLVGDVVRTAVNGGGDSGFFKASFKNGAKIMFQYYGGKKTLSEILAKGEYNSRQEILDADIVVGHQGSWQKSRSELLNNLEDLHNTVSAKLRPGGRLIFKEYFPSHFGIKGGDYHKLEPTLVEHYSGMEKKKKKKPCAMRNFQEPNGADEFRHHDANEFMEKKGWEILKVYDLATSQWFMHRENGDCRHWCHPSPVQAASSTILVNMLQN